MRLTSVRSLKQEAFQTLIFPAMLQVHRLRALAGELDAPPAQPPAVALGVRRAAGRGNYQLAVRLQEGAAEAYPDLGERLCKLAKSEIEIRDVGRLTWHQGGWEQTRQRPLLIGASVGQFNVTAGTIAAFPTSLKTGRRVLLSNNHILAAENGASLGDAILQPGATDGGLQGPDTVATLQDYVPLVANGANLVDAAVASLDRNTAVNATSLSELGVLRGLRTTPLQSGEPVAKIGRTSGVTHGTVIATEVDNLMIPYDVGALRFDRQIEVEGAGGQAFAAAGDSGALVVDAARYGVGLLFVGASQGGAGGQSLSYVNELSLVLSSLDLSL